MDMSMIEITARANFLIYNYIKRTLNQKELAEKFRKVVQESGQKDIIIFKGLEDLTLILKSAEASSAGESTVPANVEEPKGIASEEAGAGGVSKQEGRKRKKQKEQQHLSVVENGGEHPEPEPAEQQQPEAGGDKAEKKSKKKKRHLEAEGGEQPEATANVHDAAAETTVAEEGKAARKKRKKQRNLPDEPVEANRTQDAEALAERQPVVAPSLSAEALETTLEEEGASSGKKARQQKQHNQPYRRVREEEVLNKHFHDNSFDAKPGAALGWGYKANEDLRPTQGRSFRHEKTKKKRGSYKGGAIDTGVSSFKFESDSE